MQDYLPIEDYGLIGNLHTIALVSKYGSIDFMPFPRFDAPTIFTSLLDNKKGGNWEIHPQGEDVTYKQQYLPDTAILLTRFYTEDGIAELTDFMPHREKEKECVIIRMVKVVKGSMNFKMCLRPRFDYARAEHEIRQDGNTYWFKSYGNHDAAIKLGCNQKCYIQDGDLYGEWCLQKDEVAYLVMETHTDNDIDSAPHDLASYYQKAMQETYQFWHQWVDQSTYNGHWREMVMRSAITLKLLTSCDYGSTVAAATFGLPEEIGGTRNWDYRFTWMRDTAFTLYAFLRLGFMTEAKQFMIWLMERCENMKDASELQLMYTIDGRKDLPESVLDHLEGYRKSAPVRIGNAASQQFQLDIYGELVDTIYLYNKYGGAITYAFWKHVSKFVDFVADNWQRKDHGIWEVRDEQKDFLHSKVMAWVALDRGILIAQSRSFPAPLERWRQVRDEIYKEVYENYWSEERQAFVQSKGSTHLDASVLLMPMVRMISPAEPRWQATMRAIEEHLMADSMVYRYDLEKGAQDGLPGNEGTFTMCSFWYVENLSKDGQTEKARIYFEKMLAYANHLGLFSEQISLKGELVGNFPQAFTHLGLISAAYQLNQQLKSQEKHNRPKDLFI